MVMAALNWQDAAAHRQDHSGPSLLDRNLYHHHFAQGFVYTLFDQFDLHDEFHDLVRSS